MGGNQIFCLCNIVAIKDITDPHHPHYQLYNYEVIDI